MVEKRKAAGVRQVDVAESLGLQAQSRVSDWESGQRRIDMAELHAYCDAIGVDFLDFAHDYYDRVTKRRSRR